MIDRMKLFWSFCLPKWRFRTSTSYLFKWIKRIQSAFQFPFEGTLWFDRTKIRIRPKKRLAGNEMTHDNWQDEEELEEAEEFSGKQTMKNWKFSKIDSKVPGHWWWGWKKHQLLVVSVVSVDSGAVQKHHQRLSVLISRKCHINIHSHFDFDEEKDEASKESPKTDGKISSTNGPCRSSNLAATQPYLEETNRIIRFSFGSARFSEHSKCRYKSWESSSSRYKFLLGIHWRIIRFFIRRLPAIFLRQYRQSF